MKNEGREKFNNYIFLLDSSVHVNRSFNNLTVDDIKGSRPNPKVSMQYSAFILVLDLKDSFSQIKIVYLLRVMKIKASNEFNGYKLQNKSENGHIYIQHLLVSYKACIKH